MGLAVSPSAGYARMNSRAFSGSAAFSQAPRKLLDVLTVRERVDQLARTQFYVGSGFQPGRHQAELPHDELAPDFTWVRVFSALRRMLCQTRRPTAVSLGVSTSKASSGFIVLTASDKGHSEGTNSDAYDNATEPGLAIKASIDTTTNAQNCQNQSRDLAQKSFNEHKKIESRLLRSSVGCFLSCFTNNDINQVGAKGMQLFKLGHRQDQRIVFMRMQGDLIPAAVARFSLERL